MNKIKEKEVQKGKCCICGLETELYCSSCANTYGEFDPIWYCDEHYKTTVMTGNCCRGNELNY